MNTEFSQEGIAKMLSISTAHITKNTSDFLQEMGNTNFAAFRIADHEHGHILILGDIDSHKEHLTDGDYSPCPDLVAVIEYALERDCELIYLDADATEVTGLPSYEW